MLLYCQIESLKSAYQTGLSFKTERLDKVDTISPSWYGECPGRVIIDRHDRKIVKIDLKPHFRTHLTYIHVANAKNRGICSLESARKRCQMMSVMALDAVTSFGRLKDARHTCKCMKNSPTIAGFLQCNGGNLEEAEVSSFIVCSNRNNIIYLP